MAAGSRRRSVTGVGVVVRLRIVQRHRLVGRLLDDPVVEARILALPGDRSVGPAPIAQNTLTCLLIRYSTIRCRRYADIMAISQTHREKLNPALVLSCCRSRHC